MYAYCIYIKLSYLSISPNIYNIILKPERPKIFFTIIKDIEIRHYFMRTYVTKWLTQPAILLSSHRINIYTHYKMYRHHLIPIKYYTYIQYNISDNGLPRKKIKKPTRHILFIFALQHICTMYVYV